MTDEYHYMPFWGVVRLDGEPWPSDEYPGETVDNGHVLVCDGPADAAACTLYSGDPDTHACQVVKWEPLAGWKHLPDDLLVRWIRSEQERARRVADAVEERVTP